MQSSNPEGPAARISSIKMYDDYDRGTRRTVLKLYRATPDPGETRRAGGRRLLAPLKKPALVVWGAKDPVRRRRSTPSASASSLTCRTSCCCLTAGTGPSRTTPRAVAASRRCRFCARQLSGAAQPG